MEKDIKILIKKHGSRKAVAKLLGITERHLANCIKGYHVSVPLRKLIKLYAVQFK